MTSKKLNTEAELYSAQAKKNYVSREEACKRLHICMSEFDKLRKIIPGFPDCVRGWNWNELQNWWYTRRGTKPWLEQKDPNAQRPEFGAAPQISHVIYLRTLSTDERKSFDEECSRNKDLLTKKMECTDMKSISMEADMNSVDFGEMYLSRIEASKLLGVSPCQFDKLTKEESFPLPIWIKEEIPLWIQGELKLWVDWQWEQARERFANGAAGMSDDFQNSKEDIE